MGKQEKEFKGTLFKIYLYPNQKLGPTIEGKITLTDKRFKDNGKAHQFDYPDQIPALMRKLSKLAT